MLRLSSNKPIPNVVALIGALALGAAWFHAHDARIRKAAVIAERVKVTAAAALKQDSVTRAWQDSLQHARRHTDTLIVAAKATSSAYSKVRATVDTSAPQPLGVPVGSVVVPLEYVRAADSLAAVLPQLEAAAQQERTVASLRIAAADSSIALFRTELAQLRIAAELKKPGISGKVKTLGVGVIIGAVLVEAVRWR